MMMTLFPKSRGKRVAAGLAGAVVLAGLVAVALISRVAAHDLVTSPRVGRLAPQLDEDSRRAPAYDVTVTTADGLKLVGWYLPSKGGTTISCRRRVALGSSPRRASPRNCGTIPRGTIAASNRSGTANTSNGSSGFSTNTCWTGRRGQDGEGQREGAGIRTAAQPFTHPLQVRMASHACRK